MAYATTLHLCPELFAPLAGRRVTILPPLPCLAARNPQHPRCLAQGAKLPPYTVLYICEDYCIDLPPELQDQQALNASPLRDIIIRSWKEEQAHRAPCPMPLAP